MNKKFFTLAVSVLLTSAFTSVSAINTTTSPDKVVAANGTKMMAMNSNQARSIM